MAEKQGTGKKLEGLLLKREIPGEAEFKCSTIVEKIRGSRLVPVRAAQEGVLKSAFKYTAEEINGLQKPTEALNPATGKKEKDTLELNLTGEGFAQSAIEDAQEITLGASGEFRENSPHL